MRLFRLVVIVMLLTIKISIYGQNFDLSGMVKFDENKYMDKNEVSNSQYRFYLWWLKEHHGKTSLEYLNAQLDSTKTISIPYRPFEKILSINLDVYLSHPQFNNHPVVSLSYNQAINFCKWREDRMNEMRFMKNNTVDKSKSNNIPQVYQVRLPSKNEWLLAANKCSKAKLNLANNTEISGNFKDTGNNYPVSIYKYEQESNKCANLYGNVAEMTNVLGIAMGGSYMDYVSEIGYDTVTKYDKGENWIGFRCICYRIR